ncbi:hypothetical protein [Mobilicoccus massiliensis]|uniref:hypothetical protein n=1 Tax=Mobilicoccus massiliensis TaxID=1522310 RepID=UPI000590F2C3|nr:hypothetical protein [Mobilicoccus massiliensis]
MFQRKKKKIEVPTIETRTVTVPTAQGLKDMIAPAVASAAATAKGYTQEAAHQAEGYLEQVKPYLEQAEKKAGKVASQAKDKASDNPKLAEFLASGAAAREVASQRSRDAALVLKGEAKAKPIKKHGFAKFILNLGVLAALGAVAAVVVQRLQQPKDDPWARPLTDPYVAPPAGRDATVAAGEGAAVSEVDGDRQVSEAGDQAADAEIIPVEGQVPTQGENRA